MRLFILLILCLCASTLAQETTAPTIDSISYSWRDPLRNDRSVPARIYITRGSSAPLPVIIFSHGLGGSRDGYEYFGRHMAANGFVCVHLSHTGSDTDTIRRAIAAGEPLMGAMRRVAGDLTEIMARPRDVSFAIDQLTQLNEFDSRLRNHLDLSRIAVAGHSFGGYTAMAVAGQSAGRLSFRDKRISCAIAMSAPSPRDPAAYGPITIPVLLMTGTLDDSPLLTTTAAGRENSAAGLTNCDRYVVVFTGGDHMIFSGSDALSRLRLPGTHGDRAKDPEFRQHILSLSTAFLKAYLRSDPKAADWLTIENGAKATLKDVATYTAHKK